MSVIQTRTYNSYHLGPSESLNEEQIKQLVELLDQPLYAAESVLGGRTSIAKDQINGIGSVVVKYYARGGLVRHLVKKNYFKWGKTRCQIEYEMMNYVRSIGVGAPQPVAFAYRGKVFYRCWLITQEIKQHQTLAQLSITDVKNSVKLMGRVADNVSRLICNKILHVDLHPGNVLVDGSKRVFLVDFDKAVISSLDQNKLRNKYLARWKRAVVKHQLPEVLWQTLEEALLKKCA